MVLMMQVAVRSMAPTTASVYLTLTKPIPMAMGLAMRAIHFPTIQTTTWMATPSVGTSTTALLWQTDPTMPAINLTSTMMRSAMPVILTPMAMALTAMVPVGRVPMTSTTSMPA